MSDEDDIPFQMKTLISYMRSAQLFVQNEVILGEFIGSFADRSATKLHETCEKEMLSLKYYWTHMLLFHTRLIEKYTGVPGSFREFTPLYDGIFSQRARIEKCLVSQFRQLDSCDKLLALCKSHAQNLRQSPVIDVITFSILPSFFKYFVMESEVVAFTNFMKRVAQENVELFMKLARCLFVTPCFVKFMQETVKPIFENILYSDVQRIDAPAFIEAVRARWHDMSEKVPIYVSKLFAAIGEELSIRVLRECFWERFIMSPNLFSGVNYYEFVPSEFISPLRSVLADDGVMGDLVKSLTRFQLSRNWSVISSHSERVDKQLEAMRFFSVIDMVVINGEATDKNIVSVLSNKQWSLVMLYVQSIDVRHNFRSTTRPDDSRDLAFYYIRQLMKLARPIPSNVEVDDSVSADDIIEKYLVKNCDIEHMVKQNDLWDMYKIVCQDCLMTHREDIWEMSEEELIIMFESMKQTHDDHLNLVSQNSLVMETSSAIKMQQDIMEDFRSLLVMGLIHRYHPHIAKILPESEAINIISTPGLFADRYWKLKSDLADAYPHFYRIGEDIIYHLHCRNIGLDYKLYQKCHGEFDICNKIIVSRMKRADLLQLIRTDGSNPRDAVATSRLAKFVYPNLDKFDSVKKRFAVITQQNSSPFQKSQDLVQIFHDIVYIVEHECQLKIDGEDYYTPLRLLMYTYLCPPKLWTFYSYISEFLLSNECCVLLKGTCRKMQVADQARAGLGMTIQHVVGDACPWDSLYSRTYPRREMVVGGEQDLTSAVLKSLGIDSPYANPDPNVACRMCNIELTGKSADVVFETYIVKNESAIPTTKKEVSVVIYCIADVSSASLKATKRFFNHHSLTNAPTKIVICPSRPPKSIPGVVYYEVSNPANPAELGKLKSLIKSQS